jgi:NHS family xanthosine MFS transporter
MIKNIRISLSLVNFLQFFAWGAWLTSFGGYLIVHLGFTGGETGAIYGTQGIAALLIPALAGIIADRWINAERLFGICHLLVAASLIWAAQLNDYHSMYWAMLANSVFFMPTLGLNNSVSYAILERSGLHIVKVFPPIRVWGTVGFICAMWIVDLGGWTLSNIQLYVGATASIILALFAFTLPPVPPVPMGKQRTLFSAMGLDALVLFKRKKMVIFFLFSMLLGAALQITNIFGEAFLHDFKGQYPDSFAVTHVGLLMSISQISETVFILTIPFFISRFGIKTVMLMSICAWVLRFGTFALGNPAGGLPLLIFSMVVYGMAFDFFNISGSLFIRQESDRSILSSAQGLFILMTNGLGSLFGAIFSGWVVNTFTVDGVRSWPQIWFSFAGYALVLALIFPIAFRYKEEKKVEVIIH